VRLTCSAYFVLEAGVCPYLNKPTARTSWVQNRCLLLYNGSMRRLATHVNQVCCQLPWWRVCQTSCLVIMHLWGCEIVVNKHLFEQSHVPSMQRRCSTAWQLCFQRLSKVKLQYVYTPSSNPSGNCLYCKVFASDLWVSTVLHITSDIVSGICIGSSCWDDVRFRNFFCLTIS